MRNLPEWIFSFYAAHSIGAVAVAVNAWLTPEALAHVLKLTQPSLAVVDEERAALFKEQLDSLKTNGCKGLIVVRSRQGQVPEGFERLEDALQSTPAKELPYIEILPEVRIPPLSLYPVFRSDISFLTKSGPLDSFPHFW